MTEMNGFSGADPRFPSGLLLESTLVPPPASAVTLRDTAEVRHRNRLMSPTLDVAELFHVNSAISPHTQLNSAADRRFVGHVTKWMRGSSYHALPSMTDLGTAREAQLVRDVHELPRALRGSLDALTDIPGERLYSLDFALVISGRIYQAVPGMELLWLESALGPWQQDQLRRGLFEVVFPDGDDWPPLLAVIGCLHRRTMLQGPRGYRRALLDCGAVISEFERATAGEPLLVTYDFYDDLVNSALDMDGVERAALAVIAFEEQEPGR